MATQDVTRIAREIVNNYSSANWTALKNLLTPDATYNEIGTQRKSRARTRSSVRCSSGRAP
jgi:hypothetical protein